MDDDVSKSTGSSHESSTLNTKENRKRSSSIRTTNSKQTSFSPPLSVVYFGRERRSGIEPWDTSYFLSLLFELLDEYKNATHAEYRLGAFVICRLNEIDLNSPIPIQLLIELLRYFRNIRIKILVLLELVSVCERIDCTRALQLLWEFSNYGYMTLFYVLDRLKFSIVDKDAEWRSLLTIFEPLENKKHAAYIVLDKNNFYKPNQASIVFGSSRLKRYF